jgi:hypothetical protein
VGSYSGQAVPTCRGGLTPFSWCFHFGAIKGLTGDSTPTERYRDTAFVITGLGCHFYLDKTCSVIKYFRRHLCSLHSWTFVTNDGTPRFHSALPSRADPNSYKYLYSPAWYCFRLPSSQDDNNAGAHNHAMEYWKVGLASWRANSI